MTSTSVSAIAAFAAGATALLWVRPPPRLRAARSPVSARGPDEDRAALLRLRPVLVLLAFTGAWIFVGGLAGTVAGGLAGVVAWRVLGRAESPSARRRREELARDLPAAVHLFGACLTAGAATVGALESVAGALPGAVAEELLVVRHRLALGVDPVTVWRSLAGHAELRPLGRAMERAHRSGAPVSAAVDGLARELAAQSRARTDALARTVEVRAAAPLGACFLPAFLLLGVVPMVVGVLSSMRLFG
jgi:Flp pilus assembly protein TadB